MCVSYTSSLRNVADISRDLVAARWYRQIGRWLVSPDTNHEPFQTNKARVLPGGLSAVPDGLKLLKEGKVHAEKLVYRIADTPQLQK